MIFCDFSFLLELETNACWKLRWFGLLVSEKIEQQTECGLSISQLIGDRRMMSSSLTTLVGQLPFSLAEIKVMIWGLFTDKKGGNLTVYTKKHFVCFRKKEDKNWRLQQDLPFPHLYTSSFHSSFAPISIQNKGGAKWHATTWANKWEGFRIKRQSILGLNPHGTRTGTRNSPVTNRCACQACLPSWET